MIFRLNLLFLIGMNKLLNKFNSEIENTEFSKTEKYWLDQVVFDIESSYLNIFVKSEFIKSSIEKKLLKKIKTLFKFNMFLPLYDF